ncbi:unnamed protein product [Tilletia controversa]|uniref:Uncharacterized protein n=1 Tax=Tilletia caries TaxID=13290 RepID=A0ABN7IJ75_9BASI|nr:hypothetical protein CF336_g27 [Tilletia laevis]CAD6883900.1 unnamed protein product [Tilletia caries]CAD6928061.1 unnamed protein product [Tilletia controversa]CAD6903599.1 unnamed protein product [Tilletia caries]CAD6948716.1 unnamed protein product [Tilletia controversa]
MAALIAAAPLAQAALLLTLVGPAAADNPFVRAFALVAGKAKADATAARLSTPAPPYPGHQFPIATIGKTKLVFRPELFKLEAISVFVVIVYVLVYFAGRSRNKTLARQWIKSASPIIINEFSYIGAPASVGASTDRLIWNGSDEALLYASGRRGLRAMEILFEFIPRHDIIQSLFWPLWDLGVGSDTPSKRDLITIRFVLPPSANPIGVWSLVNKLDLRGTRKGRYDLGFTQLRLNAVEQRGLDTNWVLMSEAADNTDMILGSVVTSNKPRQDGILPGLQALLAMSEVKDSLASVTVTDLPFLKPEDGPIEEPVHHVVLSLRPGRSLEKATPAILTLAFNIVDALDQGLWTPSGTILAKLKKTRADTNAALLKEVSADREAEEEEARESARRQAAKDKMEKLSPAEQEKRKALEKKRQQRKSGGRMKMR